MLFTRLVSDNLEIKKQYNPETNAGEQGHVMQKKRKKPWAYETATENPLT